MRKNRSYLIIILIFVILFCGCISRNSNKTTTYINLGQSVEFEINSPEILTNGSYLFIYFKIINKQNSDIQIIGDNIHGRSAYDNSYLYYVFTNVDTNKNYTIGGTYQGGNPPFILKEGHEYKGTCNISRSAEFWSGNYSVYGIYNVRSGESALDFDVPVCQGKVESNVITISIINRS